MLSCFSLALPKSGCLISRTWCNSGHFAPLHHNFISVPFFRRVLAWRGSSSSRRSPSSCAASRAGYSALPFSRLKASEVQSGPAVREHRAVYAGFMILADGGPSPRCLQTTPSWQRPAAKLSPSSETTRSSEVATNLEVRDTFVIDVGMRIGEVEARAGL